ncbi:MAG: hypothetical protein SZ59_C0001G0192 [candidate division TM6 bacterium GW2011_GWF2_28_16]|nr:MAG: hypothetical protein SZ59_C0001G0192 [candidate division TM6 bacterium GW2011_GWF2_28_16]
MNKFKKIKKILAVFAITFVMQNFTLALMPPKRERSQQKPTLTYALDMYIASLLNKLDESENQDPTEIKTILENIVTSNQILDADKKIFTKFLKKNNFSQESLTILKEIVQKINKNLTEKKDSMGESMKDSFGKKSFKENSKLTLPEQRIKNKETGMLQELLIESGYFEYSRFLIDYLNINNELEELLNNQPDNRKQLNKWLKENAYLIAQKTEALKKLKEDIEKYLELYKFVTTQEITTVQQNEAYRMVANSEQSILFISKQINKNENDIEYIQSALETIEYHKSCALKSLAADLIKEDWATVTLPDLIKDTIKLIRIFYQIKCKINPDFTCNISLDKEEINKIMGIDQDINEKIIWNNLIDKEFLGHIFDKILKDNNSDTVKKIITGLQNKFKLKGFKAYCLL